MRTRKEPLSQSGKENLHSPTTEESLYVLSATILLVITNSDVCGPPKFLRSVYGLSSENPAVYGLFSVLSAVRVGEITVTVINNRNFSRSLKLVSLINCARCEMRRAISVCMQSCICLSLCIDYVRGAGVFFSRGGKFQKRALFVKKALQQKSFIATMSQSN